MLLGAPHIVAENHPCGVAPRRRVACGVGEVGPKAFFLVCSSALAGHAVRECARGFRAGIGGSRVGEVVALGDLRVAEEGAEGGADGALRVRGEADFVGGDLRAGDRVNKGVGRAADAIGLGHVLVYPCAGVTVIGDLGVADVERQVLRHEQVVRVVHPLVGVPIGVGPGVDDIQPEEPAFKGQVGVLDFIVDELRLVPLDLEVLEVRVRVEDTVGLDFLLGVGREEPPVVGEVVAEGQAAASVAGLVDVVINQVGIVGILEVDIGKVGASLEALAVLANLHAIVASFVGFPEAGALAQVLGAGHIVNPAALGVRVAHGAQGGLVRQGQVDHALEVVAGLAVADGAGAELQAAVGARRVRLVGDHADGAGLGAGAEQSALGTGQDFQALHVRRVDVQVAARLRQRLLVQVEGDIGRKASHAGSGEVGRGRGNAAHIDGGLARASAARGDIGQAQQVVVKGGDAGPLQRLFIQGLDGHCYVLGAFGALGGRDDHLLKLAEGQGCVRGSRGCQNCCAELVALEHGSSHFAVGRAAAPLRGLPL